jgi:signal transduction histidine kinase
MTLKKFNFGQRSSFSLKSIILVPFVGLTFLAVGLVWFVSFRNSQEAVHDVARQLRNEINRRIEEHLDGFMALPRRINETNAEAISGGLVDPDDQWGLSLRFMDQIRVFDSVTSINFGNTEGGLANAGREGAAGSLYVILTEGFRSGEFRKYSYAGGDAPGDLIAGVPGFDSRTRSWYVDALSAGADTWSQVHVLFTGQDLEITASRPVFDAGGKLLGVTAVNLFLSHLGDFLSGLDAGRNGQSFIVDEAGFLVASSSGEEPFRRSESGEWERIRAADSVVAMTKGAAASVEKIRETPGSTGSPLQFEFLLGEERHLGQVTPFGMDHGLDWFIFTVIPESYFMSTIREGNRTATIMMLLTLALVSAASLVITRKIVSPISILNSSARQIAEGDLERAVDSRSRIWEIGELSGSFAHMAEMLRVMISDLKMEIEERQRAEGELAVLNRKLQEKNRELEQVVYAASHDLRSPLVNIDGYGRELEFIIESLDRVLTEKDASEEKIRQALSSASTELAASLNYIRSGTLQMDSLLKGLLKLSRAGRVGLDIAPLDMNEIVSGIVSALAFQINEADVEVDLGDLPPCLGDPVQVGSVFSNILGNALKYLDSQRRGKISVRGWVEKNMSLYRVFDNGVGIPSDQQERIFGLFVRLDRSGTEGDGIGLTLARNVLGRMNGEIRVESVPGKGSSFYVALPSSGNGAEPQGRFNGDE